MRRSLLIRGPLGVGKSTTASTFAATTGARVVAIDLLLEKHGLWKEGRLSEFLRANTYAVRLGRRALAEQLPVVFDGNFYWKSAITLRAPLATCIDRDRRRARPYGEEAARAVFAKSTRFEFGRSVDATRPLREVVGELRRLTEVRDRR
jgi:hypothetical protein